MVRRDLPRPRVLAVADVGADAPADLGARRNVHAATRLGARDAKGRRSRAPARGGATEYGNEGRVDEGRFLDSARRQGAHRNQDGRRRRNQSADDRGTNDRAAGLDEAALI